LVVEVGGANTLEQSLKATRVGGTIVQIGVLSGKSAPIDLTPVFMKNVRLQGILVGHRTAFERMCEAIALHKLEPVVDRVFSWEQAPDAFAHLEDGRHFGKVVVRVA
ncbi:MAG: zinc-binding dehydrogenase, partial [Myxococcales bacterium]|nr:zinc-binding dehydrogenase [Myxococcales bacterium]